MGDEIEAFLARLQRVLGGRKPYPWAAANGLSRGAIGRLLKGELPDPEKLLPVIRSEGLSLSWLMTGQGTPYLLHVPATDAQAAELIAHLCLEMGEPSALIVLNAEDPRQIVVVLSEIVRKQPADGEPYEYRHAEVVGGPACSSLAATAAARAAGGIEQRNFAGADWRRLASGYMSLHELWSMPTATAYRVSELQPSMVAEAGPLAWGALSDQEQRLVHALRAAPAAVRETVVTMVESAARQ